MKQKNILDSRDRLARRLPDPTQIARGTLLRRTIRHARGCSKCRAGGGHPVWVLTVTYPGGRTRQFSIRRERSEEHTSELQSHHDLVCRLLLEKKKQHENDKQKPVLSLSFTSALVSTSSG